jgi:hypothetical protein
MNRYLVLKTGSGTLASTINLEDLGLNPHRLRLLKSRINAALAEMQAKGILRESTTAFFPDNDTEAKA